MILDLGDDLRSVAGAIERGFQFQNVLGLADEGKRQIIQPEFQRQFHIGQILFGEGRETDLDAGR